MPSGQRASRGGEPTPGEPRRPTREEIARARDTTVPDVIAVGLRVLFCGINPSLYSAAVGHHFARPGNRFWPSLHSAGLTDRVFKPHEGRLLLGQGFGITNIVERATARADELTMDELVAGQHRLDAKVRSQRPAVVAVLGVTAYRIALGRPRAVLGRQPDPMADAVVWILPNPSGLNASFSLDQFHALRAFLSPA